MIPRLLVAVFSVLVAGAAKAQTPLDPTMQQEAVAAVSDAMRTGYVLPDAGDRAAARIEAELAAGSYAALVDATVFADRLTADLRREAPDLHLRVHANAPPPLAAAGGPPAPRYPGEAGLVRADLLPGGVGYLQVINFTRTDYAARPAIDRAMAALAGTRALIIDLRGHGGGGPGSSLYLLSHFLPAGKAVVIDRRLERKRGTAEYTTTEYLSSPVRRRYLRKPVYVLIGSRTFSGGEMFAYDMQAMKLGRLVGQTTRGGAHSSGPWPINGRFILSLPTQRFVSPVTGVNWEGKGVSPDLPVPGPQALRAALNELGVATDLTSFEQLSQKRVFEPRRGPLPRTEAALRRFHDGFPSGSLPTDALSPAFRQAIAGQLDAARAEYGQDGPTRSLAFAGSDPEGMDIFEVTFTNGVRNCRLLLDPTGAVDAHLCGPRRRLPPLPAAP